MRINSRAWMGRFNDVPWSDIAARSIGPWTSFRENLMELLKRWRYLMFCLACFACSLVPLAV
jgi:hypothetical protein